MESIPVPVKEHATEQLPILQAENLVKTFSRPGQPSFNAVDHVSFRIMPGECLGMIGESGSGKTTIASLITRMTEPTQGSIILDGEDITGIRGAHLRRIYRKMQMVFQSPAESFDPRRTLGQGIGESLRNAGMSQAETKARTRMLLEQCGLEAGFAKRYPFQVSGGQCQRAAIARALAVGPQLLICDEATSALDVTIQAEILELLNDLRRKKEKDLSILFICHDIALVQQFCSRVLVLHKGRIVEEGTPDEVIRDPKDPYTKQLIENVV